MGRATIDSVLLNNAGNQQASQMKYEIMDGGDCNIASYNSTTRVTGTVVCPSGRLFSSTGGVIQVV